MLRINYISWKTIKLPANYILRIHKLNKKIIKYKINIQQSYGSYKNMISLLLDYLHLYTNYTIYYL